MTIRVELTADTYKERLLVQGAYDKGYRRGYEEAWEKIHVEVMKYSLLSSILTIAFIVIGATLSGG